ncbi:MAG TPA: glycoside hydrolase family 3 N-terminal domain-containing protein [Dehalococcoidia bacterium]|nr:glycoside hydrolase family 3 N-terminal domain-containing protein [Dehalococcoidia bacterium]
MKPEEPLYRDPRQPVEARVNDLLVRMTLDEKLAQLGGVWSTALVEKGRFDEAKAADRLRQGAGHITRVAGSTALAPGDSARLTNACQRWLIDNTRLGIPAIVHEESCAGYAASGATCFPQAIGLASTWEPELIEAATRVIRAQMRSVGAHQTLAPVLDVARDPRWGRTEETFGEDPYLISRMGVAYVKGVQGDDPRTGITATGKHFVGYSASEGGMNWAPAHIGRRELLEVYVTPFLAAIQEARLGSIMNAYHELDGVPCGASPELFEELLRRELGFDGVVVTDYNTIPMLRHYHHLTDDKAEAACLALEAGLDVELPEINYYAEPLRSAVEAGRIDIAFVDRAVSRVLRMKFQLGLFEDPYVDAEAAPAVFDTAEQRDLARRIAQKSIVLLKNEGDLLPLSRSVRKLAVVGPNADNVRAHLGDYHYPAHADILVAADLAARGVAAPPEDVLKEVTEKSPPIVTVLQGIRSHLPDAEIVFAKGCEILDDSTDGFAEAVEAARQAEVALVVVGDRAGLVKGSSSGESIDRAGLGLPGVQQALVEAVVATGTPTVVILTNGRPYAIPWIAERVPAILEAWFSGEEGGSAIADVLFGDAAPGGKLPISLPYTVGQLPVYYAHKPSGGRSMWQGDYIDAPSKPLFPFGHGLSYTQFEYANLALSASETPATGTLDVSCDVTNRGQRAGEEVVQLYVQDMVGSVTRPVKELKGFKRIALAPAETRRLTFHLDLGQLAFYDREMRFVVEPGEFGVYVGSSSEDIRLLTTLLVTGGTRRVRRSEVRPTTVEVS